MMLILCDAQVQIEDLGVSILFSRKRSMHLQVEFRKIVNTKIHMEMNFSIDNLSANQI
jgi:hypothetical protein